MSRTRRSEQEIIEQNARAAIDARLHQFLAGKERSQQSARSVNCAASLNAIPTATGQVTFDNSAASTPRARARKRVFVVGAGGSGLTTAYMLENMRQFKVTLADDRNHLGGHIDTIYFYQHKNHATGTVTLVEGSIKDLQRDAGRGLLVQEDQANDKACTVTVKVGGRDTTVRLFGVAEGGAEFIGSRAAYPNVHKLFDSLSVRLKSYELNANIHHVNRVNASADHEMILPPLYDAGAKSSGFFSCCNKSFSLSLSDMQYLILIQYAITSIQKQIAPDDPAHFMTLEEFVGLLRISEISTIFDIDDFANRVLYPLLAAAWGDTIASVKQYGAHYIMNYLQLGKDWHDASNGLSTYIDEIERRCEHLDTRLETTVRAFVPVVEAGQPTRYKVMLHDGSMLKEKDEATGALTNEDAVFDEVINTTPPGAAASMLPERFPSDPAFERDLREFRALMAAVTYYPTEVIFHTDASYRSSANTVVHTRIETLNVNGAPTTFAANTACKEKLGKGSVCKTWWHPGQSRPNNILATRHYNHPRLNAAYFLAELKLKEMNAKYGDKHGLRFGGILWRGDSHEDAVTIGLVNAEAICCKYHCLGQNARLAGFLHAGRMDPKHPLLYTVNTENSQLSTQTTEEAAKAGCCAGACS